MGDGKSLFERLDGEADDIRASSAVNGGRAASVRRHIRKLLNTRAGSVATVPDYGLTDFNDVAQQHSDLPGTVATEVADLIRRYEPRLSDIAVTPHPSPDNPSGLRFTVAATLVQEDGTRLPATFDLSLGRDRPATVT
jgi:type VI secretion system protein